MESKAILPAAEDVIQSFDLDNDYYLDLLFKIFEDFSGIKMQEDIYSFVLMASSSYPDTARHGFLPTTVLEKKSQLPKIDNEGGLIFSDFDGNMREAFNEMIVFPFFLKYHDQIKAIHQRYKKNQLSSEEFYQKYRSNLPGIWDYLRSIWGATLEDFLAQTPCTEGDVVACNDKFKHHLFGFIAVYCMDEVQNSWPQNLELEEVNFTAEDVIALGGRFQ